MRLNLSEELVINDDISLNDGSEVKEEQEKEAEKLEKEANKELEDKVEAVEEINKAEAEEIDLKDPAGKTIKIKGLTEGVKLTLEEPSDILTEDLEEEPVIAEVDDHAETAGLTMLLTGTWNLVDTYNSVKITVGDQLDELITNLYINIGKLEGMIQERDSNAVAIEQDDLGDVVVPTEVVES